MTCNFHPAAERELVSTIQYYEDIVAGLGEAFLEEIEKAIHIIQTFPYIGSPMVIPYRKMLLHQFPYAVIY